MLGLTVGSVSAQSIENSEEAGASFSPSLPPEQVAVDRFLVPEGLEVSVWASTPQLFNPTNMDVDHEGRIWVCEGVRYRRHKDRREGDRVVVLEDTDGDGKADSSHTFVQEEALIAPLGIGVFDNKIFVSQPPSLIVYTDVDRDLRFDPEVDKREEILTGFNGRNHDHSLHSVTGGPGGKLIFNVGNCGGIFEDRDGKEFVIGGPYFKSGGGEWFFPTGERAGEPSDDGHVWMSGATFRMNEDGSGVEVVGHGYRNSYEQTSTSYGDLFQNDNDDPPACRTSYILEYGNAGYFSRDGKRFYRAEKRPGQDHARNHWRQDDPGTMDAGDIYGGGSPTGVAYYENGALGSEFAGTLLACEPGKNTIFGYQPEPQGATFSLDRTDWMTSNSTGEYLGSDFTGGTKGKKQSEFESHLLFRPSDVVVGPDGALYVCDWYDARVGGHGDLDDSCSGTIYRIAPKGFSPQVPEIDLETVEGALTALKSPAVNPRYLGFHALKKMGEDAFQAVDGLLADKDPYLAARAVWLLPHLGDQGMKRVEELLEHRNPQMRIAALRALRRAEVAILPYAKKLATDADEGVRRDVALALRHLSAEKTLPVFLELAKRVDIHDKNAVEAIGLGAVGKEDAVWKHLHEKMAGDDPVAWDARFAKLTWRLWSPAAIPGLKARATAIGLTPTQRAFAVETLAFIDDRASVDAMLELAESGSPVRKEALDWLFRRGVGEWAKHNVMPDLKERGIYDPSQIELKEITVPRPPKERQFEVADVLALKGDAAKGKATAMRCVMCHQVEGVGPNYGPSLKGWGTARTAEVIARAIVEPDAEIAHGYHGSQLKLKNDGGVIEGLVVSPGDPVMIISTGGVEQLVPRSRIERINKLNRTLMLSADQLALSAQDVADLVAYLQSYE
ncbi:MAG: HEAT repeat domain-containing protein [Verrucomicrobiota bacterium JB023]|nr:HEAT repeat domain-containing protein [Verrucomicrobiota bacterium JB023]